MLAVQPRIVNYRTQVVALRNSGGWVIRCSFIVSLTVGTAYNADQAFREDAHPRFAGSAVGVVEWKGFRFMETTQSESDNRYQLQTLMRGAAVLDLLADNDHLTLKQVATALKLNTTIAYRVLKTWVSSGYLDYDVGTKHYYAGVGLLRLASKSHSSSGLPDIEERLRLVNRRIEQTVSFSVLAGRFVLYVARVVAHQALMYQVEIGKTLPAYATSAGHVLLAHVSLERLLELFPEPELIGFTERTVRTRDELLASLASVRDQGYAINRGQLGESIVAVAVPARDKAGAVVGAFSIAGASQHFTSDDIFRRYLPALLEAAKEPVKLAGLRT